MDYVVTPAEVRLDKDMNHGSVLYAPTTLVMTFPAGELDELRRLLKEDHAEH